MKSKTSTKKSNAKTAGEYDFVFCGRPERILKNLSKWDDHARVFWWKLVTENGTMEFQLPPGDRDQVTMLHLDSHILPTEHLPVELRQRTNRLPVEGDYEAVFPARQVMLGTWDPKQHKAVPDNVPETVINVVAGPHGIVREHTPEERRFVPQSTSTKRKAPPDYAHDDGFRCIRFQGKSYTFTPNQAAVVAALWQAWEEYLPGIADATLLETIETAAFRPRLRDIFKESGGQSNPAWGEVIVKHPTRKGMHRLNLPDE